MSGLTRSGIVIRGPRSVVAALVLLLESPELGRRPGSPPLPLREAPVVTGNPGRVGQLAAVRDHPPEHATVTGPILATVDAATLEVRYTVVADGSSARSVAELARRIPEITVVLTERTGNRPPSVTVHRAAGGRRPAAGDVRAGRSTEPPAGSSSPPGGPCRSGSPRREG